MDDVEHIYYCESVAVRANLNSMTAEPFKLVDWIVGGNFTTVFFFAQQNPQMLLVLLVLMLIFGETYFKF